MTPAEQLESFYDELGAFLDADAKEVGAVSNKARFSRNVVAGLHDEKLVIGGASELRQSESGLSVLRNRRIWSYQRLESVGSGVVAGTWLGDIV